MALRDHLGSDPSPVRRNLRAGVLACLVIALVLLPETTSAQEPASSDLQRELREAEERRERLEDGLRDLGRDLEAAELELAEIGARLSDAEARSTVAEGQVALAEVALADAEDERDAAAVAHERSEAELAELDEALAEQTEVFADQVVETFKYGTVGATRAAMMVEVMRQSEDPGSFAVGMRQLRTVVEEQDTVVEAVEELREERTEQANDAARARARAFETAEAAAELLDEVEDMRDVAAAVAAEVEHEEEQQREVLASLRISEAETAELVERAEARQQELEVELRRQREREEERRRAAEREARRSSTAGAEGGPDLDGMICPVVGAVAGQDFTNDWGYPRSGGRTHQGNDIFASRGTPVVAVGDGEVVRSNPPDSPSRLGGITVTYRTADGSEWYNAHLDRVGEDVEVGASVSRGQEIGTVGNTGNARSTPPHLHLGRRYDGGWTNPWPTVAEACR